MTTRITAPAFLPLLIAAGCLLAGPAGAARIPHPVEICEKGDRLLAAYRGNPEDLALAEGYFRSLINTYPDSPLGYLGMSRIRVIEAYLNANHFNMKLIREEALPYAVKALEKGPLIRLVHDHYGLFEYIYDQYELNQKTVRDFLNAFPDDPETYFFVAAFLIDQDEMDKAVQFFQTSLEMNPRRALRVKILNRLGMLYLDHFRKPEEALKYFQEGLTLEPESPGLNEYAGIAYLRLKQYQPAVERLEKAFSPSRNPSARFYLLQARAGLWAAEGRNAEAIKALEAALGYRRSDADVLFRLGNLYYQVEDYAQAYKFFKKVIGLRGRDPQVYFMAGKTADFLGKASSAQEYYSMYRQLNGQSGPGEARQQGREDQPAP